MAEHPDVTEVETAREESRSVEPRELGQHKAGVCDANRERRRDVHLRTGNDDVAVGKLDDARIMGMVDRHDDVAVAGEVLDQARVELASAVLC